MRRARIQPKPAADSVQLGSADLPGTESPRAGGWLQWVTARVPASLVREIDAHAKRLGTTRSDAIRDCLGIGIEAIRSQDGIPAGRVEQLLGAVEGLRLTLDLVGPPTFGMLRLLAHWAARDGSVKVSEDELLAEVRVTGAEEWEQAVSDAERDLAEKSTPRPQDSH